MKALNRAAVDLAQSFRHPLFLVKGGHLKTNDAIDALARPDGHVTEFASPRIPNVDPHGTGCTYSAAIAAGLARGLTPAEAVLLGKVFISRALKNRFEIGPYQLLNHLPPRW
jgi:hydroxymethylpyrimidine/phosphomethylpyrimidine kinase